MFRRIRLLQATFVRNKSKSVKITKIQPILINQADRMKTLYMESSILYGAKIKEEKGTKKQKAKKDVLVERNDLSSEMYWLLNHTPEAPLWKPSKEAKKASNKSLNVEKKSLDVEKTSLKKEKLIKKIELPETLNKSAEIKSTLNSALNIKPLFQDIDDKVEQEIPFGSQQLSEIVNFPMFLNKSKTINAFEAIKRPIYLPSVSKILQATMPESQRNALIQWKHLKIAELGLQGFNDMQKSHLSRGKQFHQCVHNYFNGEKIVESDLAVDVAGIWRSIEPMLGDFKVPGVYMEEKLEHPYLLYQGVLDCVSFYKSTLSVIEWKKSDRPKKSLSFTYDAPIQLASYLGAINASKKDFKENPIKRGVVVVAYNDGQKADLFELNEQEMKKYWKLWLSRLQEYYVRYKDNTLPEAI